VTERTREIGVRLAIGARRADVGRQFLIEAAMLSCVGGLVGIAIAAIIGGVAAIVAPGFPVAPPLWSIASGVLTSIGVGLAAGYLPARRASALNPVDALRYE
jgi:macrolide transport system ATP-binding/permease protein